MKFLIDAQLPVHLAKLLEEAGYDAIHTKNLVQSNRTSDEEINRISMQENRIVVSKDSDFFDSFLLRQEPYKLLQITTGNISNQELITLFFNNLPHLIELFEQHSVIELSRDSIIVHQ